jgi:hypothetical protein
MGRMGFIEAMRGVLEHFLSDLALRGQGQAERPEFPACLADHLARLGDLIA